MRQAIHIVRCGLEGPEHEHVLNEETLQEFSDDPTSAPLPECLLRAIVGDWLYNARRLNDEQYQAHLQAEREGR